jgi:adenylate kinase
MKIIVLLGAPGAGKGTQARRIAQMTGLKHMSTGEMLRSEVAAETPIGKAIAETLEQGNLVSDELIIGLIRSCIRDGKCPGCQTPELCHAGFVLDGFPRNVSQAKALDRMVNDHGRAIDHVILLDVDEKILKSRIENRARESANKRSDDTETTLYHRLSIYSSLTKPIIPYYEQRGVLRKIDGMLPMDEVTGELFEIITGRKAA